MGFDVTFHPISTQEMNEWYFEPLKELKDNLNKKGFFNFSRNSSKKVKKSCWNWLKNMEWKICMLKNTLMCLK